jgi:hypothetical protein
MLAATLLALLLAAPAFADDPEPDPPIEREVVASWSFDGDQIYADGGADENIGAPLQISGDRNITFVNGPSGSRAASANNWQVEDGYWLITVSTRWFESITVSSRQNGSNTGPRDFVLEFRPDDAASWIQLDSLALTATWTNGGNLEDVELPASATDSDAIQIRWRNFTDIRIDGTEGIATTGTSRIAQIVIRGVEIPPDPNDPAITVAETPLAPFEVVVGNPSDAQSYGLTGVNLSDPIEVTAPAGFEVSEDGTSFAGTLFLNPVAGEVDATVHVRLTGAEVGAYGGMIRHESPGARTRVMSVSGTVLADWPPEDAVIQITGPGIYDVPSHGLTLTFHTVPPAGGTVTVIGLDEGPEVGPPGQPAERFLQLLSDMPNYAFEVTVSVDVSEWDGIQAGTRVAYFNEDHGQWVLLPSSYSSGAGMVTFDTRHFTTFAFTTLPSAPFDLFVSDDPATAAEAALVPNASWADTGHGPDDWSLTDAEITMYLVPAEGAAFQSIDVMVEWDPDVLELVEAGPGNGLFSDGGTAAIFHDPLGAPGRLSINAARLALNNYVIDDLASGEQYVAAITFTLANPGYGYIDLTKLDVRSADGLGGQGTVYAVPLGGAVRAYLGDVGAPGDPATGDGAVDFEDLMLFSAAYWSGVPGGPDPEGDNYMVKYDVGPTQDGSIFSMPEVDGEIQFEDLVIFSLSYGYSAIDAYPRAAPDGAPLLADGASGDEDMVIHALPARVAGAEVRVPIAVAGAVDLRAVSLAFEVDLNQFAVLGATAAEDGLVDSAELFAAAFAGGAGGTADAARLGGSGIAGQGELLELRLTPLVESAASFDGAEGLITLRGAIARDSENADLPVILASPAGGDASPLAFRLEAAYPNPASGSATIAFELPERAHVRLAVYDLLGRRAALLADGDFAAGRHALTLDTNGLASGAYVYRIEAGPHVETRRLTIVR